MVPSGHPLRHVALALMLALTLAGCAGGGAGPRPAPGAAADAPGAGDRPEIAQVPMKVFAQGRAAPSQRANSSIATQFLALSFTLESGRTLPVLSRFEGPITLRLIGGSGATTSRDLDRLLSRLRNEAGIDIRRDDSARDAAISVAMVPRAVLQRSVPSAACFVAPNVSDWAEYRSNRNLADRDWARLVERRRMAVFLPGDVSPQEIRDCLHEEIAQALGPVNDLYELSDSIFNDDNFRNVLTGFDMVTLRAYYDDALHSGMSREAVAAALPGILSRINPAGARGFTGPGPTPRAFVDAIGHALAPAAPAAARRLAAERAVALARGAGPQDPRLGFAWFVLGRARLGSDAQGALAAFAEAQAIFSGNPATRIHAAHVAVQAAAWALSAGRPAEAIAVIDRHSPDALQAENAELLASLLMIKAQALEALGRSEEAAIVRLDSIGWARYGFGSDAEIRRRLDEIAELAPRSRTEARR